MGKVLLNIDGPALLALVKVLDEAGAREEGHALSSARASLARQLAEMEAATRYRLTPMRAGVAYASEYVRGLRSEEYLRTRARRLGRKTWRDGEPGYSGAYRVMVEVCDEPARDGFRPTWRLAFMLGLEDLQGVPEGVGA